MSKSSQRKLSMYQLGIKDFPVYVHPVYPNIKEYMKGWNSVKIKKRRKKMPADKAMIIFSLIVATAVILQMIFGGI